MQVRPLGQRVLAEPVEAETKTASGLIIPDSAKEKPQKAKVIAISKELEKDEKNELQVGQTIIFGKYSGTNLEFDGKQYIMLKTEDILAII
jgi:chaperonin GroES